MMQLCRIAYTDWGTFGKLSAGGGVWTTVERPWAGNRPNVSCVPEGVYQIHPARYYRGGYDTWELTNVPGRSEIKIHIGNTMDDVSGCIAVGEEFGCVAGKWAVIRSKQAFTEFYEKNLLAGDGLIRIYQYMIGQEMI